MSGYFPNKEHRDALAALRMKPGFTNRQDRVYYHAYDYGWRRVFLNDYNQVSAIDALGEWFDGMLVREAEAMWRRKFNVPKPVAEDTKHLDRTPEDITWATEVAERARTALAAWAAQNKRALNGMNPVYVADTADLETLQRKLGLVATPEPESDEEYRLAALRGMGKAYD